MLKVVPCHGRVTPDFLFSDTGAGAGKCKPKLPPEIGVSVVPVPGIIILWPLVFRLRPQAAFTGFGLQSATPYREAPKMTRVTKKVKISNGSSAKAISNSRPTLRDSSYKVMKFIKTF